MSDGIHRMHDDEDEWFDFKTKYKLKDTGWPVYSHQATWAKQAVKCGYLDTSSIKLFVRQQQELMNLKDKHAGEWAALYNYEKLKL